MQLSMLVLNYKHKIKILSKLVLIIIKPIIVSLFMSFDKLIVMYRLKYKYNITQYVMLYMMMRGWENVKI